MTHSGGKPHAVGDKGQRYETTFVDPNRDEIRRVYGWVDTLAGARVHERSINAHPTWHTPLIQDRQTGDLVEALPVPANKLQPPVKRPEPDPVVERKRL